MHLFQEAPLLASMAWLGPNHRDHLEWPAELLSPVPANGPDPLNTVPERNSEVSLILPIGG